MRSLYPQSHFFIPAILFTLFSAFPAWSQPAPEVQQAYIMLEEAEGLIRDGAFDEAVFLCQDAEQLFVALEGENSPGVADAMILLGEAHRHQRKLNQALQFFNRALEIRLTFLAEKHADIDFCYSRLGNIYEDKGNYDQAINFYQKAMEIRKEVYGEPHLKVVSAHRMLGAAYYAKGDFDRAYDLFEKGFLIQTQLAEDPACFQMRLLINMGASLTSKGDFDQAELFFHKALALRENYPPSPSLQFFIGAIYQNLGETFHAMNKPQIAITHLDSALVYYHPKSESVGSIFGIMADCYSDLGDFIGAEQLLDRWKDHWAEHLEQGHHYHSRWYQSAGEFYVLIGDYDRGIEYLQTALDINLTNYGGENPQVARSYIALGEALLSIKEYAPAKSNFQYALVASRGNQPEADCSNPEFIVASYQGIGNVYMERYFAEDNPTNLTLALSNFQKALDVLKCHQSSYYSAASKARLSSRSYPSLEQAIRAHRLLFERSGDQKHLEAAFAMLEQSKSVLLFESIQEAEALQFAGIPDDLLQQENDLRIDLTFFDKKRKELKETGVADTDEQMIAVSTQLLSLQQRYEDLKDQFEQEYPTYFSLKYDLETITLTELQSNFLDSDQTLLEYFVGDQFIYLFAIRNDAAQLVEIPLDFDLETTIQQMRHGLYGYHSAANRTDQLLEETVYEYVAAGQELYRHLILPVGDFIEGSLLIVPDGILGYIPFETLLKYPPSDVTNFASYDYLFLEHPLSYNYSATLLQEMVLKEHFEQPADYWLGFAPFFDGSYDYVETQAGFALEEANLNREQGLSLRTVNFTQLPNSGDEMALGSTLWEGTFFLGSDATREQFFDLAGQFRILHLSTHGVADPRVGDFSYLAFAQVEDEINNELLYVRDLYNMQLNADLVVLSACETGVGELQRGEGIISLARAFAYAGAKSIITSLWVVDDASTRDLMQSFYVALKKGKSKDRALQLARIHYLEDHPGMSAHPFFWAGFIPIGDMQTIGD